MKNPKDKGQSPPRLRPCGISTLREVPDSAHAAASEREDAAPGERDVGRKTEAGGSRIPAEMLARGGPGPQQRGLESSLGIIYSRGASAGFGWLS